MADALDHQAYQDGLCPGCRTPTSETMDPANSRAYDAEMVQCFKCAAGDIAERMYRAGNGDPAGLRRRIFDRILGRRPPPEA